MTERDTEPTEQSGVEKFCWQTMILYTLGVHRTICTDRRRCFCKRRLENCRISSWKELRKGKCLQIIETLGLCEPKLAKLQFTMEERGINTVQSTSAGRLFDAVSAILDIRKSSTFEGEASTSLQFAAEKWLDAQKKKIAGSEDFAESGIITDYGELKSISDVAQKSVVEKNNSINRNIKADLYYLPTLSLVKELAERKLAGRKQQSACLTFPQEISRDDCLCLRKSKRRNRD